MSIELKPCPFCGGRASVYDWQSVVGIGCSDENCPGSMLSEWCFTTTYDAADVWNTRAERTCHNDSLKRGKGVFACSECGAYLDIADMNEEDMDVFYEPRFCPNCGAKVVE